MTNTRDPYTSFRPNEVHDRIKKLEESVAEMRETMSTVFQRQHEVLEALLEATDNQKSEDQNDETQKH